MRKANRTKLSIVDLRKQISEIVNTVNYLGERVVLTKHNKPVAAIVPMDDLILLEVLEDRLDLDDAMELLENPNSVCLPLNDTDEINNH